MANKYRVSISYLKFMFDDRNEALDFAETAFEKIVDDNGSVEMTILREQEDEEDE